MRRVFVLALLLAVCSCHEKKVVPESAVPPDAAPPPVVAKEITPPPSSPPVPRSKELTLVAVGKERGSTILWLKKLGSRVWLSGRGLDAYADGDGPLVRAPDMLKGLP
jgi:hypothetical protein